MQTQSKQLNKIEKKKKEETQDYGDLVMPTSTFLNQRAILPLAIRNRVQEMMMI